MKKVDLSEMTEIDEAGNIIKPAEHRREASASAEPKEQRIYEADEKENLVSRAAKRKKHKNHTYGKGRVKKVVMSLILALSATFLALTGCTADTTDPGKTPGTDPGTNPGTNPTEYSQLLEDILDSEYYNRLSDDYFDLVQTNHFPILISLDKICSVSSQVVLALTLFLFSILLLFFHIFSRFFSFSTFTL